MLTLEGPLDTGKTALMQSVIASVVVHHALTGSDPALILATSTDSPAITEIIESFGSDPEDPLASRWLPGVSSHSLYWPAPGTHEEEARTRGYPFVSNSGQDDFPSMIETRDYFDQARTYFLSAFKANLRMRPTGLKEAVADLHRRLGTMVSRLQRLSPAYLAARDAQALDLQPRLQALRTTLKEAEAGVAKSQKRLQAWIAFQARS